MPPAKLQRLLQDALAHHRAGRLADAAALYAQVLKAAPLNFDAVQLSGVVALQQGRYPAALTLLSRALRLNPRSDVCLMRLGIALNAVGRFAEAERQLRAALALTPSLAEASFHLAAAQRTDLREEMRRSPLLDHAGQAARFGAALRTMWAENWGVSVSPAQAARA